MKALFFLIFLSSNLLFSEVYYHRLLEQFPETLGRNGSWKQGEIEIATSPKEIARIEKACYQRYLRMGYTKVEAEKYSRAGVISEDHYWIWVRDAVTFPGGIPGVYNRIIIKSSLSGSPGTVILPVMPNKKIVVNINFRHATRSWELELPRGQRKEGETPQQTALRELREETGCIADQFISLGNLSPETGVISSTVPVFYGQVRECRPRNQDESEAIAANIELSLDEIKDAFKKGYTILEVHGIKTKVYCRDPFFSYALLQAMWLNLI